MEQTSRSSISSSRLGRGLIWLSAVVIALSGFPSSLLYAQTVPPDFEAPVIELEQVESGVLGDTQVFSATVTDNSDLKKVSLFYRFNDATEFSEKAMQALGDSSFYTARVATAGLEATSIEYYVRAEDSTGNSVFKAYTFDPLVRTLTSASAVADSTVQETQPVSAETPAPEKKNKTLYYILGALAVLAVAGLASSGGGGGGTADPGDPGPTPGCGAAGCNVQFVVSPPLGN